MDLAYSFISSAFSTLIPPDVDLEWQKVAGSRFQGRFFFVF